ncbi:MAG: O-antigen ligase family protein [Planctomycetes bacterium]|nr:O-antigen ligase family protein [Planctomycetota bacterium]
MSKQFRYAFFLTLLIFVYVGSWVTFAHGAASVGRWVALALMCLFVLSSPKTLAGEFRAGGVQFFAFVFAATAVASSAWSFRRPVYTFERGLSACLLVIFLFRALWGRLKGLGDYAGLMDVLVKVAWVVTGLSVILWAGHIGYCVRLTTGAVQGIFGNPNMLGMVLAILLPITLARFYSKKNVRNFALVAMTLVLLYRCQSRAGLLGGLVGVGVFFGGFYGRKIWLAVLVLFAVAAPVLVMQRSGDIAEQLVEEAVLRGESDTSQYGSGRIGLWLDAFELFKDRPFGGHGFGTAGDRYYADGKPARWHSSFVQIGVELGIVGLFFFFAPIIYMVWKMAKYHVADVGDYQTRAMVAGLVAAWCAGAVDSGFESWLFAVGNPASILHWTAFVAGVKAISSVPFGRREVKNAPVE